MCLSLEVKFYSEDFVPLKRVNLDNEKRSRSYVTFSPRAIWDRIFPTRGAILKPWPENKCNGKCNYYGKSKFNREIIEMKYSSYHKHDTKEIIRVHIENQTHDVLYASLML